MVDVKKERKFIGYDCWGKAEYDDIFVVRDKDENVIYKSKDDPTKLIKYLTNHNHAKITHPLMEQNTRGVV